MPKSCVPLGMLSAVALTLWLAPSSNAANASPRPDGQTNTPIPWNQIGAKAGADYQGDGLSVTPTADGARLHCVFQRLDGEATPEGLWLTSTVTNTVHDRFQVKAASVGRRVVMETSNNQHPTSNIQLSHGGKVSVDGQSVRFVRP